MSSTRRANGTVVGVDSSTQSCKVLVVDVGTGEVVARGSAPHPDGTAVDVHAWRGALEQAWDDAGARERDDVIGVGVSAQQHGLVALDRDGAPVHDALLWNDLRSAPQARDMTRDLGVEAWVDRVGTAPVPAITLTKLAWLRQEQPELADRVVRVGLPHDWLTSQLTDGAWVTDRSDASGTGWYDAAGSGVQTDLLERWFGGVPDLPTVLAPGDAAGAVGPGWLPRSPGAVVSAGCGDNAGAGLGLGVREGDVVVSIGTSGTVFARSTEPVRDPSGVTSGFADAAGGFLPLLCTLNAARVLARTADLLGVDVGDLDELVAAGSPDCDGLTLLPYLDGERTPSLPDATGRWHGLTGTSMTRANLARSATMAVANSLADGLDVLRGLSVPVHRAVVIGGGARSAGLRRCLADVLDVPVEVPAPEEYVALGAARQAVWAASGGLPEWRAGDSSVERLEPRSDDGARAYRERYRAMRAALETELSADGA